LSLLGFPLLPSWETDTLLAVGIISLLLFIMIEPRIEQPVVRLRLFRDRLFALANLSNLLNGIARGAVLFLLIFFLQGRYGKDPLTAGLLLAPYGAALLVIAPFSGLLSDRIGSRLLAPMGLGIAALGLLGLTTIGPSTPYWMLAAFMALVGGGSGFFVSPNTNAIMSSVSTHRAQEPWNAKIYTHDAAYDAFMTLSPYTVS
jgi:MFS family permease